MNSKENTKQKPKSLKKHKKPLIIQLKLKINYKNALIKKLIKFNLYKKVANKLPETCYK